MLHCVVAPLEVTYTTFMKCYVYALRSEKDHDFYTGFATDIQRRFAEHNRGKVISTRYRRPFGLVYYEVSFSKKDALAREKYLKSGMGKRYIRNRLKIYLGNL